MFFWKTTSYTQLQVALQQLPCVTLVGKQSWQSSDWQAGGGTTAAADSAATQRRRRMSSCGASGAFDTIPTAMSWIVHICVR